MAPVVECSLNQWSIREVFLMIIFDISDQMMLAFIFFQGIIRLRHKHRREISFSAKLFSVSLKNSTFFFLPGVFIKKKKKMCEVCVCSAVSNSATPWTVAHQVPLSTGFSRQEYFNSFPFSTSEDLPNPGIEHVCPMSPAWASSFFSLSHLGSHYYIYKR